MSLCLKLPAQLTEIINLTIENKRDRTIFLVCPTVAAMVDAGLTLHGQSSGYWSTNAPSVQEGNPVGYYLLSTSPWVFVWGVAAWVVAFAVALLLMPRHIAKWVSFAICLSHVFGASTWIIQFDYGVVWVILFCVIVRIVLDRVYPVRRGAAPD